MFPSTCKQQISSTRITFCNFFLASWTSLALPYGFQCGICTAKSIEFGLPFKNTNLMPKLFCIRKAEAAARDSRKTKQDRYEEMRRRKDEEREAQERLLVRHYSNCCELSLFSVLRTMMSVVMNCFRKKKLEHGKQRRRRLPL
jgi:hypothetical protein